MSGFVAAVATNAAATAPAAQAAAAAAADGVVVPAPIRCLGWFFSGCGAAAGKPN